MTRLATRIKTAGAALAALALAVPASAQTAVEIDRENPVGTIQPEVYGQFVEFLGTQVYGGMFVGEDSDIPNTDGIRDDVFAALDALDIPVIRWPGGCYADQYHWRDGVGANRVKRDNLVWGNTPEPNTFGTHEFFNLAERLGAKTYLNLNIGTGTVREAAEWLEYITSNSDSALAEERRANGRDKPWKVDYFTFGNETWDCGGNMRPEYYGDIFAHYATFVKTAGKQPYLVLSGSHDNNADYTGELLDNPEVVALADGVSLHFYTLPTQDWDKKGAGLGFPEAEWASSIERAGQMDRIIQNQLKVMDEHSPDKKIDLLVDEWGQWVDTPEGAPALWQQNSIRDAVVAGLTLNVFHKHADRVPMANIAQMVNVLQAMILTDGPKMILTPTYHVFEMYKPFQGATSLPVTLDSPEFKLGELSYPALSASAARTKDGNIVVGLVNGDSRAAHPVSLAMPAGSVVSARVLTSDTTDGHNDFDHPDAVKPVALKVTASGSGSRIQLPARSVAVVVFKGN